jgi:hypothetical protein
MIINNSALWEMIVVSVESLSWEEVLMNEVGVQGSGKTTETARNDRILLSAALIGQLTMTPDDFLEKCRALAMARNCRLFRGRDGSVEFRLRQPRRPSA